MATSDDSSANAPLTSWKAIAHFFGRDVRTVQRWEKEEGMPVQRHLHRRRSSVYADPEALRGWWNERRAALAEQDARAPAEPAPPDPTEDAGTDPAPSAMRRRLGLGVAALGLLAIAVIGWRVLSAAGDRKDWAPNPLVNLYGRPPDSHPVAGPVGDFNGDAREDLVLSTHQGGEAYLLLNTREWDGRKLQDVADVTIRVAAHSLMTTQAGDFNGDGIEDLVLSHVLGEPESLSANGSSFILWGRRQWPAKLTLPQDADVVLDLVWPTMAGITGCAYSRGTDLNGDGLHDILLGGVDYGSPERRSGGGAFVLFGRKTWPRRLDAIAEADVTFEGAETGEGLGARCSAGDFDGDGVPDLLITASQHTLWNMRGSRGRNYLFRARRPWPRHVDARTDFDLRIDGVRASKQPLATAVGRLIDVNGDGRDDVIIAQHRIDDGEPSNGDLRIFFGGDRRGIFTVDAADAVVSGSRDGAGFGGAVAPIDLDDDGVLDLVVSELTTGAIHVLFGRREWPRQGSVADAAPLLTDELALRVWYLVAWNRGAGTPSIAFTSQDPPATRSAHVAALIDPFRRVTLDVRPDHDPNFIIVPDWICVVRVFGFSREPRDAIDPATLRLAGAPPLQYLTNDYNGDGIVDVQAHFDTGKMRLDAATQRVWIRGRTRGGTLLAGDDAVVISPRGAGGPAPRQPS